VFLHFPTLNSAENPSSENSILIRPHPVLQIFFPSGELVQKSVIETNILGKMAASALLKSRVRRPSYLNKLCKAEDLIDVFPHGTYIGWSGFTGVGYPK
jgi:hypothetical protein